MWCGVILGTAPLLTGCGRQLGSCAASIIIFGPVTVTITCPPPGFQLQESSPVGGSTVVKDLREEETVRPQSKGKVQ